MTRRGRVRKYYAQFIITTLNGRGCGRVRWRVETREQFARYFTRFGGNPERVPWVGCGAIGDAILNVEYNILRDERTF